MWYKIIKGLSPADREKVYSHINKGFLKRVVRYVIDSRYREAVKLSSWLKRQVDNPSSELLNICDSIKSYSCPDKQVIAILKYVRKNLEYVVDDKNFGRLEYWATANEVASSMLDDCDGGAVLIYVLSRLKGVPANQLFVFAGDTPYGGHAWAAYVGWYDPNCFVFLDWCYFADLRSVPRRSKYGVDGAEISGDSRYQLLWFGFNEDFGFRLVDWKRRIER